MIKSVVEQASTELGIPLDLLIYLAGNPDALRAAEEGFRAAPTQSPTSPESPRPMLDFTAELQIAFTKNTKNPPLAEEEDGARWNGQVGAPDMRRERTAAIIEDARATESDPHDRFRMLPRKVWNGKNAVTRQFLVEQYEGRCQICGATFAKRDGSPYFEGVYLVSHTNAAWIDRPGNVLCLCPTCTAKFLHGEVHAPDVLEQIHSWRAKIEGGCDADLHLMLCGEPQTIRYTEKHLLDLQTMIAQAPAPRQASMS